MASYDDRALQTIVGGEGDVEESQSQGDVRKAYLRGLRDLADALNQEYELIQYPADCWQERAVAALKPALSHLLAVVTFLEKGENFAATKEVFEITLQGAQKYAELLGPFIVTCSLAVCIACVDTSLHNQELKKFASSLANIDRHLKHMEKLMPNASKLLDSAGQTLEELAKEKSETGERQYSKTLKFKFRQIEAELAIIRDRLERVEQNIFDLQNQVQYYKRFKTASFIAVFAGSSVVCAALNYFGKIDKYTLTVGSIASSLPLLNYLVFLKADVENLWAEIKKREEKHKDLSLDLKDLKTRLQVYQWSFEVEFGQPDFAHDTFDGRFHSV